MDWTTKRDYLSWASQNGIFGRPITGLTVARSLIEVYPWSCFGSFGSKYRTISSSQSRFSKIVGVSRHITQSNVGSWLNIQFTFLLSINLISKFAYGRWRLENGSVGGTLKLTKKRKHLPIFQGINWYFFILKGKKRSLKSRPFIVKKKKRTVKICQNGQEI